LRVVATGKAEAEQNRGRQKLPLEQFVPARLAYVSRQLSKFEARKYAEEFGITIPEWRVVVCIANVNSCSSGDICSYTGMDKPMVHRAVTRLVALGHIVARISDEDRRSNVLRLSKRGKAMYDRIVPIVLEREALLLDCLSLEERKGLLRILAKLQRRIEELGEGRQEDTD
jgi:DNA-binding MarR family transcriptional regulator